MIRKYSGVMFAFVLVLGMLCFNQFSTHAESVISDIELAGKQASMTESVSKAIKEFFGTTYNFTSVASFYFDSTDTTKMVFAFAKEDSRLNLLSNKLSQMLPSDRYSITKVKYSENELKKAAKEIFYKYAKASKYYDHLSAGINTQTNKVEVVVNKADDEIVNQIKKEYGDIIVFVVDPSMPQLKAMSRTDDYDTLGGGLGINNFTSSLGTTCSTAATATKNGMSFPV